MKKLSFTLTNFFNNLLKQNRLRKFILISLDSCLIIFSIWLSVNYFNGIEKSLITKSYLWIYIISLLISIPLYVYTNHYKTLSRYTGSRNIYFLFLRNLILFFLVFLIGIFFGLPKLLFKSWALIFLFSSGFISLTRFLLRDFLLIVLKPNILNRPIIVIYGAGNAGNQLAKNLLIENSHIIKCFVDDNKDLYTRNLHGISIYNPNYIQSIRNQVEQIFIAIPSASVISVFKSLVLQAPSVNVPPAVPPAFWSQIIA